jgi:hypothetical protein
MPAAVQALALVHETALRPVDGAVAAVSNGTGASVHAVPDITSAYGTSGCVVVL